MEEIIQEALSKGIELHVAGEYDLASQLYESVIKLQPDHPDANHNMGVLKLTTGHDLEALSFLQTALQANTSCTEFWLSYIKALIKLEKLEDASKILDLAKESGIESEEFVELNQLINPPTESAPDAETVADASNPPQETLNQLINLYNQGKLKEVVERAEETIRHYPNAFLAWNILGLAASQSGALEKALSAFQQVITLKQDDAEAHYNLGVILQDQGQLDQSIECYKTAISFQTNYAEAYNNIGKALQDQGNLEDALKYFDKAIFLKPDFNLAHFNMGVIFQELGNLEMAINLYNTALSLQPDHAEAYNNLGNALQDRGKFEKAKEAFYKALSLKPDYADAHYNMGNTLKEQGKLKEAIEAYNKALSIQPDSPEILNNIGHALQKQGLLTEAMEAYDKALLCKPDYVEAHNNIGSILMEQGKLHEALAVFNKAISLKPDYADAYCNKGIILRDLGKLNCAIDAFGQALTLKPDFQVAKAERFHQQAHICDWAAISKDHFSLKNIDLYGKAAIPFLYLSMEDAPERHLERSKAYVNDRFLKTPLPLQVRPTKKPERLRIGYFSADFHNHASMYLMAQIFAAHDKSRFQVFAYSYGHDKQDEMRKKLVNDVEIFHDVRDMNDIQIVHLARSENLDIAIDLKGFTAGTRLAPFSHRLAPLQISYLGYPGTLGAEFIDYIVADPVLIPGDKRKYYSEQIIYLPNTYHPTDNTRFISEKSIARQDVGLPSKGFVFCCFNNNYKISPKEFDIWMRLLSKVEDSVLWLLSSNRWAQQNLMQEAETRGISAERLVFAERVPHAEHLARQRLADLFLDTFNVNAHTTASDALWAGLPVVTKLGEGFAARVAGSLLTAIGLPELITKSEDEYEALALKLTTNPEQLARVKSKLEKNRLTQPLFDSEMYTRHLQAGYQMAYDLYFNGQNPSDIFVPN